MFIDFIVTYSVNIVKAHKEEKTKTRQTTCFCFGGAKLYTHALRGSVVGKDKLTEER